MFLSKSDPPAELYELAMEAAPIGICVVRESGEFLFCNTTFQRLLAAENIDMEGSCICHFLPDFEQERFYALLANVTSYEGSMAEANYSFRIMVDGVEKAMQMRIHPTPRKDRFVVTILNRQTAFTQNALSRPIFTFGDVGIIAYSRVMIQMIEELPSFADVKSSVLITGDSGTGKELIAKALHNLSSRKDHPFVAINCGAFPETLLESELFGYKKGAFTGASSDKKGRFAIAEGGTLFLDEIGEMTPSMQVKLLRVLQEKQYTPLGSEETVTTDVRIVAATNRDLKKMVDEGKFRLDLYYRVCVIQLFIPPLRERKEAIPHLVSHFIEKFNNEYGKQISGMSSPALKQLLEYDYPGNIRELENIVERSFAVCPFDEIQWECLPDDIKNFSNYAAQSVRYTLDGGTFTTDVPTCSDLPSATLPSPSQPAPPTRGLGRLDPKQECRIIAEELVRNNGSRAKTAKALGISTVTLWRKMKKYGLK